MKRVILLVICFCVLLAPALSRGNSFVFQVKPGAQVQSFDFGIEMGKITPYMGLDLLGISADVNYTEKDWRYDYSSDDSYLYKKTQGDLSGSALLLIPHLGAKYNFASRGGVLFPYVNGGIFIALPFVSAEMSEEKTVYNPDGSVDYVDTDEDELDQDVENSLEDVLAIWGLNFGFGTEYRFSEHFGVSGEIGFRLLFTGGDFDDTSDIDDGVSAGDEVMESELSSSLKLSYSSIVLNYHF